MKRLRNVIEYAAVLAVRWTFRVLPRGLALVLGAALGWLAWVLHVRRSVALTNLKIAFGDECDERSLSRIARKSYREMGRVIADFLRMPALAGDRWRRYIEVEGEENLKEATAEEKGVIIVSGHFGSWELICAAIAGLGGPVQLLVRRLRNPLVDRMVNDIRQRVGMNIVDEENVARDVLRALRANKPVGILIDQDAGKNGVFVDFFGVPASTFGGAAAFAVRTGAPIVVCAIVREGSEHRLIIEPPIHFERTGDREKDLQELTQLISSAVERHIRKAPDRYFWMHRRWKTRPSGRLKNYTYEGIKNTGE